MLIMILKYEITRSNEQIQIDVCGNLLFSP